MGRWGYAPLSAARLGQILDGAKGRPLAGDPATEEWRSVVGYEGLYSVSSLGRVRGDRAGRVLSQSFKGQDGYVGVRLVRAGEWAHGGYTPMTHVLVAAAFIGPKADGMQVNHRDGNKLNNAVSNLEYVTGKENHEHAADMGLHAWGRRHGMVKLTEAQVRECRSVRYRGSIADLAAKFGVSRGCIQSARSGKSWSKLDSAIQNEEAK